MHISLYGLSNQVNNKVHMICFEKSAIASEIIFYDFNCVNVCSNPADS